MVLKNLEFEIKWHLRQLIEVHGVAVVMHGDAGKNLISKLKALETVQNQAKTLS